MSKFAGCWFGETTSLSACRLFIRAIRQDIRSAGGAGWWHSRHFDMSRGCINDRRIPFRGGSCLLCTTLVNPIEFPLGMGHLNGTEPSLLSFRPVFFPPCMYSHAFFPPATLTSQRAGGLTFFHIKRHDLNVLFF